MRAAIHIQRRKGLPTVSSVTLKVCIKAGMPTAARVVDSRSGMRATKPRSLAGESAIFSEKPAARISGYQDFTFSEGWPMFRPLTLLTPCNMLETWFTYQFTLRPSDAVKQIIRIGTSAVGRGLAHPYYGVFLERLKSLRVPVFLHGPFPAVRGAPGIAAAGRQRSLTPPPTRGRTWARLDLAPACA